MMGSATTKVEIVLSNPKTTYAAGEKIEGRIKFFSERNITFKDIQIVFRGQLVAAANSDDPETYNLYADETTVYLADKINDGLLIGGRAHEFKFVHRIPGDAPHSLQPGSYYVRYWLKAVVTRTLCNIKSEKNLNIVNELDFERCTDYYKPASYQVTKTLGGGLRCARSDMTAKLWTERGCFIPGDNIQCFYTVQNSSPRRITSASLKLLMEVEYLRLGTKWEPFGNKKILSTSLDCLKVVTESFSGCEVITVPQVLPTYISNWVLQIRYYIQLSLGISGTLFPLEVKLQIRIGTKHPREHKR